MFICIPLYKKVQTRLDKVTLSTRENLVGARVIRAFAKEEKEISKTIERMFNLDFKGSVVDKKILRDYLVAHPKDIAKINRYICQAF